MTELPDRIRRFRCLYCENFFALWTPPLQCPKCKKTRILDFDRTPLRVNIAYRRGELSILDIEGYLTRPLE